MNCPFLSLGPWIKKWSRSQSFAGITNDEAGEATTLILPQKKWLDPLRGMANRPKKDARQKEVTVD